LQPHFVGVFFFAFGLKPHSVRVFFYGANNTSLFVVVANPEGKYEALEKYGLI
jgi:hypothetical protein